LARSAANSPENRELQEANQIRAEGKVAYLGRTPWCIVGSSRSAHMTDCVLAARPVDALSRRHSILASRDSPSDAMGTVFGRLTRQRAYAIRKLRRTATATLH
jgi:hypothetical protein